MNYSNPPELNCACDECEQAQMLPYVEHMPWGIRITWRCVETRTPYAWAEVKSE